MAEFQYTIITPEGKTKKGNIEAKNKEVAVANLKAQHNTVTSITEAGGLAKKFNFNFGKKVKKRDFAIFCQQFVSINGAGVTIIDAFQMLSEQTENNYHSNIKNNFYKDTSKSISSLNKTSNQTYLQVYNHYNYPL